jgi:hypothetical protein
MTARDLRPLLALAVAAALVATARAAGGLDAGALSLAPALLLLLPLLAGRYVGEERIERLVVARRAPRRARAADVRLPRRHPAPTRRHGGRLLAARLAGRAPPVVSLV